jgi:hypothetical protein
MYRTWTVKCLWLCAKRTTNVSGTSISMTTTSLFTQTGWGRLQTHWSQKTRIQTKGKKGKMKDNKRTNIEKEERQLKTETNKKVKKNK